MKIVLIKWLYTFKNIQVFIEKMITIKNNTKSVTTI